MKDRSANPVPFYMYEGVALDHGWLRDCSGFKRLQKSAFNERLGEVYIRDALEHHPWRTRDPNRATLVYVPLWEVVSFTIGECNGTSHSQVLGRSHSPGVLCDMWVVRQWRSDGGTAPTHGCGSAVLLLLLLLLLPACLLLLLPACLLSPAAAAAAAAARALSGLSHAHAATDASCLPRLLTPCRSARPSRSSSAHGEGRSGAQGVPSLYATPSVHHIGSRPVIACPQPAARCGGAGPFVGEHGVH